MKPCDYARIKLYMHALLLAFLFLLITIGIVAFYFARTQDVEVQVFQPYKPFSMYIENTKGTLEWNEKKVSDYVDDYNLRHVHYKT